MRQFDKPAIIVGTGPSLQVDLIKQLKAENKVVLFGVNNTFQDFDLDVWIACDPSWHKEYSPVDIAADCWHWDPDICERFGYQYIPGHWGDGLSVDPSYIHFGHSSGYQALNLAVHYGCSRILLCGYDMHYRASRHYFTDLSDKEGEYPQVLRKYSTFDGLITCYQTIADQSGLPEIINCSPGSALDCFPLGDLLNATNT